MSKNTGALAGWGIAGILTLALIGQCSKSPTGKAIDNEAAAIPMIRYVSARSLNCRLEPAPTAGVSRGLKRGEQLSVGEEKDGWVQVNSSPPCWVTARYLSDTPVPGAALSRGAAAPISALSSSAAGASSSRSDVGYSSFNPRQSAGSTSSIDVPHFTALEKRKARKARRKKASRKARNYDAGGCPCSGRNVCIGPRGGRYCITSGGNKRYGV